MQAKKNRIPSVFKVLNLKMYCIILIYEHFTRSDETFLCIVCKDKPFNLYDWHI